jgi:hypothetical protein
VKLYSFVSQKKGVIFTKLKQGPLPSAIKNKATADRQNAKMPSMDINPSHERPVAASMIRRVRKLSRDDLRDIEGCHPLLSKARAASPHR